MGCNCLPILPVLVLVFSITAFVSSYIISWRNGTILPVLSFISDAGSEKPASCIFAQLLNMVAVMVAIIMYAKYLLNQRFIGKEQNSNSSKLSKIALGFGLVSAFLLTMLANFQESAIGAVHWGSALGFFTGGFIYSFIDSYITLKIYPGSKGRRYFIVRLLIATTSLIFFLTYSGPGIYSVHQMEMEHMNYSLPFKYDPSMKGYVEHVVSAVGEWLTVITFLCYFLTYTPEFKGINLRLELRLEPTSVPN